MWFRYPPGIIFYGSSNVEKLTNIPFHLSQYCTVNSIYNVGLGESEIAT